VGGGILQVQGIQPVRPIAITFAAGKGKKPLLLKKTSREVSPAKNNQLATSFVNI